MASADPRRGVVIDRCCPIRNRQPRPSCARSSSASAAISRPLDAEVRLALGQMKINKAEAQTDPVPWGGRQRGWCCVAGWAPVPDAAPSCRGPVALLGAEGAAATADR